MPGQTFGQLFKACRMRGGKTLRSFCLEHGLDAGNISRLERGRLPPPQRRDKLTQYAEALGVQPGSDEWLDFFDLAAVGRGRIPADMLSDSEVVAKLPALFRTIRGQKPSADQLDALVEKVRRA